MSPHLFLSVVTLGSAAIGLWLAMRLRIAAKSAFGAVAFFAAAWILPGVGAPLLMLALTRFSVGPAILVSIFPVLTAAFALTAGALRYLADVASHAIR